MRVLNIMLQKEVFDLHLEDRAYGLIKVADCKLGRFFSDRRHQLFRERRQRSGFGPH